MLRRSMLLLVAAAGAAAFAGAASAQTGMKAPAGAEQGAASQPTVQLAPGVTFAMTELRRVPEKGVMELKFVVANEGQNDVTLKGFGLAYDGELANIAVVDQQF